MKPGTCFQLEVNPRIPRRLIRLEELAGNLWYSWHRPTRTMFARLDRELWRAVGNNPKEFLRRIDEQRLVEAAEDQVFLAGYNQVLSAYDTYHIEPLRRDGSAALRSTDLIAYFCAEFGFHESFPIYSGGLGILAGDHCKGASDLRLPFVAVGLLYRQGYFHQQIDGEGNQLATNTDSDFDNLPITPCVREDGSEVSVSVELPGRRVVVKAWQARIGHVTLYLLDTDVEHNSEADRDITHQLYGGDGDLRIKQEMVLGIGGVRLLRELGLKPTVWHINEGHAAFMVLSRIRKLVLEGLDFASALEAVAANTVFTTHTPVPAGHDQFDPAALLPYLQQFVDDLGIDRERLLNLGRGHNTHDFNMTALAISGSRFHNGVSKIHGAVSAEICANLWPQIEPAENPLSYVTNGVHVPTFLAYEWVDIFDRYLGHEWRHNLCDEGFWSRVDDIPDHVFWSVRQSQKAQALVKVRNTVSRQHFRNHGSDSHLDRVLRHADPLNANVLTIGFARRFATYKRATLLFEDTEWLKKILDAADRPVLFIFAGKAHPADRPGQDMIRAVSTMSRMRDFEGKILLLEGYDMGLARRLISGVDVWLNNPVHPLEASGTSGMKAAINGGINLSVLDGWWGEGYDGRNGWAIKPSPRNMEDHRRDREESQSLYEILEDHVIPLYYDRGKLGYSEGWVKMAKRSMATTMSRFNSTRMVSEYVSRFYIPATRQFRRFAESGYANAARLSFWKGRVRQAWSGVRVRRLDAAPKRLVFGKNLLIEVALHLNGLTPEDVAVELLFGRPAKAPGEHRRAARFAPSGAISGEGEHRFALDITPELCGSLEYRIRVHPWHQLLTHPLEMGLMLWL